MSEPAKPGPAASAPAEDYGRDGYSSPHDIISPAEAAAILADMEAAEAEVTGDRQRLSMLRAYTSRLLPSFDALIRHPHLIDAVGQILGPDLLVWGTSLFIKEPRSQSFVSWHQDLNYWG